MNTRRTIEELKKVAINLSEKLGKTPSRKELSAVMKESEYGYYGMTVTEFQEYCGFHANKSGLDNKKSDDLLLGDLAKLCMAEKVIPHQAKFRKWIRDGKYHGHTLETRFGGLISAQRALYQYAKKCGYGAEFFNLPGWKIDFNDIDDEDGSSKIGYVYLFQHGLSDQYKIGKTYNPIKREGQIKIELPEKVIPIHYIKTDDPSGVENYWHRRFADKKTNGEWFSLSKTDINSFKRWKNIF